MIAESSARADPSGPMRRSVPQKMRGNPGTHPNTELLKLSWAGVPSGALHRLYLVPLDYRTLCSETEAAGSSYPNISKSVTIN